MKWLLNISNVYILVWFLYFFHWRAPDVFPIFDRLSNAFLAIGLGLSLYYFFLANVEYKLPALYKVLNVLLLLFTIYGLSSIIQGNEIYVSQYTKLDNGSYLIGPLRSFLPFYAFYVFFKKGLLSERAVLIWVILFFTQMLFCFIRSFYFAGVDIGERVTNSAYSFVTLLPFLFLVRSKNNILSFALLFVGLYIIMLGLKRGAILVSLLFALYFIFTKMKYSSIRGKVLVLALILMAIPLGVGTVSGFYNNNVHFQKRIEDTMQGNSSGRDEIGKAILRTYSEESNLFQLIFGYGADGSVKKVGIFAHNDWLELLIDMGIVGVVVYLLFWISFVNERRHRKDYGLAYIIIGGMIVVMLPRTVFSMGYSAFELPVGMLCAYSMLLPPNNGLKKVKDVID